MVRDHKFIEGVDGGGKDPQPMGPDWVSQLLNTNTIYDLILAGQLQKPLVEHVVFVASDKSRDVPDYCQNIEFISFDCVVGQKHIVEFEVEDMVAHNSHHFVSLHIMHVQNVQVIETAVERLADFELQIDCSIEYS